MATKTSTKPAPKVKPATKEEKPASGVGVKELAADLGRKPTSVRAAIRRINGGPGPGQGGKYSWTSRKDPKYVKLLNDLQKKEAPASAE